MVSSFRFISAVTIALVVLSIELGSAAPMKSPEEILDGKINSLKKNGKHSASISKRNIPVEGILIGKRQYPTEGILLGKRQYPTEGILLGKRQYPTEGILLGKRQYPTEGILLGKRDFHSEGILLGKREYPTEGIMLGRRDSRYMEQRPINTVDHETQD